MRHQKVLKLPVPHARRLLAVTLTAGVLAAAAGAATAAEPAAKPSSCVACHTNVEKLKAEAANIPVPAASALQAGKG